ncbi:MAG: caspase family protein [Elusimicrobiota bacterium]
MMTSLKKSFAVLCCATLIAGCAGAPPAKRFTGDRQNTPIHELTVTVVSPRYLNVSFNDRNLKELTTSQNAMAGAGGPALLSGLRLFMASVVEPEKLYRAVLGTYYQGFKSVTIVESVNDPRVAQSDMIAIPDVSFAVYPPNIGAVVVACEFTLFLACLLPWTTKTSMNVSSAFYTPDHSLIATVKAAPINLKIKKMPLSDPKLDLKAFPESMVAVSETLDTAIQTSPELLQYAKSLKSKSSVAQTPAAKERVQAKVFESDVDRPGYHFEENAANYAVVVGVENYANVGVAEFAKRDAEAMKAHLRALGYPGQNIALLTDAQATGNKLKSYIESWLPRNVKPESKVFVYFAGHGAPDTESKQAYLLLWDGDPQYISDTGYPLKRLYEKLNALNVKEVVLALDSGFSGAGGRSVLAKGARPLVGKIDAATSELGKLTVLTAAGSDEIAGSEAVQGHGLFTYYLLKSLNEGAGNETLGKSYASLNPKVQDAARKANQSQNPQLLGGTAAQASLK